MRKVKLTLITLFTLFAILAPFAFTFALALMLPPAFGDTFVGVLDEKFERLNSVEGEKIVVIGGSSVAFGLDSKLLEEYVGMPVVNFGLYAALGTRLMLDLSLSGIGEGDVVVIAPEIDRQTLSLYFNQDTAWRAMEGNPKMLRYVGFDNIGKMAGGMFGYVGAKLVNDGTDAIDSTYSAEYFNEYGDYLGLARPQNTMFSYYDKNTPVYLNASAYGDELSEFLDYVNAYTKKCARRGAAVYFSFSPINALAVADGADAPGFEEYLAAHLECDVISSLDSRIMDAGYFYDTNFHLNDTGVVANTLQLARDVRLACGIVGDGIIVPASPEAPELPEREVRCDTPDENDKFFTYERLDNGAYTITGLTELGKAQSSLTLPLSYNNYKVLSNK